MLSEVYTACNSEICKFLHSLQNFVILSPKYLSKLFILEKLCSFLKTLSPSYTTMYNKTGNIIILTFNFLESKRDVKMLILKK